MVKVTLPITTALATCLFAAAAWAENINFINQCDFDIQLFHSQSGAAVSLKATIPIGNSYTSTITGPAHMFRHTADPSSTLFEISIGELVFFDISIIPPNPGFCPTYEACRENESKTGFNVPMSVVPTTNANKCTASSLLCAADDKNLCSNAYLFPMDNTKTHSCPCGTSFDVTFCYANNNANPVQQEQQEQQEQHEQQEQQESIKVQPVTNPAQQMIKQDQNIPVQQKESVVQQEESVVQQKESVVQQEEIVVQQDNVPSTPSLLHVRTKYAYLHECAGNVPGTYNAVVDLATCTKKPVTVNSRVGPLGSASVSLILRGPMSILNIAVYTSNGGNDPAKRVSYYSSAKQTADNLVFMNNGGVDYSGKHRQGPQSYASADGKKAATKPTVFNGKLDDASHPNVVGGGPGISTGTEINIMTGEKCDKNNCDGSFGRNDHAGWKGKLMVFVTEVIMFEGPTVNRPATWLLPTAVMYSGQYGCNCRGMGPVGGCGELDIAEVIETNVEKNKLSTHHYFFDGKVLCPGGDNFFDRRYNESTVFITIIDEVNAMIKIVEAAKFDFRLLDLSSLYDQLLTC